MPKFNDSFNLNIQDVELIEQALRIMWSEDEKEITTGQSIPKNHQNAFERSTIYWGKFLARKFIIVK